MKGKASIKHTKSVILQIRGMYDQADRVLCLRRLQRVKGVVSVKFQVGKNRCLLCTKHHVTPESLVQAVAKSMTMSAHLVIRNVFGREFLLSYNVSGGRFADLASRKKGKKKDNVLSPYLFDDGHYKPTKVEDGKNIVCRRNKRERVSRVLSAAVSFLSRSFY